MNRDIHMSSFESLERMSGISSTGSLNHNNLVNLHIKNRHSQEYGSSDLLNSAINRNVGIFDFSDRTSKTYSTGKKMRRYRSSKQSKYGTQVSDRLGNQNITFPTPKQGSIFKWKADGKEN